MLLWSFGLEKGTQGSHHPAKFCGHRFCGRGDIIVLVCNMISQDHVNKGYSNIMGRSPSQ